MSAKPFKILGIQQIAIGGPDKARLKSLWVDMLGLTVKSTFVSERENVDEDICQLGNGPTAVEVDLMQPLDPEKKPAVHTTPLNHVGLWVDDLPKAVEWMTANGVRFAPGGIRNHLTRSTPAGCARPATTQVAQRTHPCPHPQGVCAPPPPRWSSAHTPGGGVAMGRRPGREVLVDEGGRARARRRR